MSTTSIPDIDFRPHLDTLKRAIDDTEPGDERLLVQALRSYLDYAVEVAKMAKTADHQYHASARERAISDLEIHVETWRGRNHQHPQSTQFEANALIVLDLLSGNTSVTL